MEDSYSPEGEIYKELFDNKEQMDKEPKEETNIVKIAGKRGRYTIKRFVQISKI